MRVTLVEDGFSCPTFQVLFILLMYPLNFRFKQPSQHCFGLVEPS